MDPEIYQLHAEICQTLSNPKRLEVLELLSGGEKTVGELAVALNLRQANLSQHLSLLRQRGVVATRREGTNIYYHVTHPKIIEACRLLREVLLEQLKERAKLVKKLR